MDLVLDKKRLSFYEFESSEYPCFVSNYDKETKEIIFLTNSAPKINSKIKLHIKVLKETVTLDGKITSVELKDFKNSQLFKVNLKHEKLSKAHKQTLEDFFEAPQDTILNLYKEYFSED